jgi:hypothetical protein
MISGYTISTPGFPPSFFRLASTSPKALDTESLPGNILNGPNSSWSLICFVCSSNTFTKLCVLFKWQAVKNSNKNLLVNFTPSLSDSLLFGRMTRLVICGELYNVLAACCRHKGSWVPNIDHVAEIINDNQNDCTWATAIKLVLSAPRKSFNSVQEVLIGLLVGIDDCLLRVLGKLLISYDKLM